MTEEQQISSKYVKLMLNNLMDEIKEETAANAESDYSAQASHIQTQCLTEITIKSKPTKNIQTRTRRQKKTLKRKQKKCSQDYYSDPGFNSTRKANPFPNFVSPFTEATFNSLFYKWYVKEILKGKESDDEDDIF